MRLLALTVQDFRGIDGPLTVDVAEQGVTLVSGPNEAGKSSLIEAWRLLRDVKASSQSADVRAIRPTHRQADPRVTAELRTGPYHLTYSKTFSRKGVTELTVHAPRPESHAGDAAHERASAIIAETVDADLWRALSVVQGAPLDQPVLAELAPLHRALAENDDAGRVDVHADLLDRVEAEYLRYFTRGGRPTGDYARLAAEREGAETRVAEAADRLRAVERLVAEHESLARRRDELGESVADQRKSVAALRESAERLDRVREELREARVVATAARHTLDGLRAAWERRQELVTEAERAAEAAADATRALEAARAASPDPGDAAEDAEGDRAVEEARARLDAADEQRERARAFTELARVERRVEAVREATRRHAQASEALRAQTIDDAVVARLAEAHQAWQTAAAQESAAAPRLRVERLGQQPVLVDGAAAPDDELAVTAETVVEVDGVVRVTVRPEEAVLERASRARERDDELRRLLGQYGVADVEEARRRAAERAELEREARSAAEARSVALGEETDVDLEAQLAAWRHRVGDGRRVEVAEAEAEHDQARLAYEEATARATAARETRRRARAVAQELRDRLVRAAASAEHAAERRERAGTALASARTERDDDALREALAAATEQAARADEVVAELERVLADEGAEQLAADLATALSVLEDSQRRAQRVADELIDAEARLDVLGRDGLRDALSLAEAERADLERSWASLDGRARAAELLYTTLTAHAQRARQAYVEPFRAAMVEIGRTVFGPDFDVEIGEDLSIVSRALDGRTVPFASLSGGAREQLGVLGRVATAQLVSEHGGAPVIFDDILGYADPERRERVVAMLNAVAREGRSQIIVLTCDPRRFDRLIRSAESPL